MERDPLQQKMLTLIRDATIVVRVQLVENNLQKFVRVL